MTETEFKKKLVIEIYRRFPGSVVIKNDPNSIQGFPDLTIFFHERWATLETKKSKSATHRPNQDYWVDVLNNMSFSSFIYPENKDEVLDELEEYLKF